MRKDKCPLIIAISTAILLFLYINSQKTGSNLSHAAWSRNDLGKGQTNTRFVEKESIEKIEASAELKESASQLANITAIAENCGVDNKIWFGSTEKDEQCLNWMASDEHTSHEISISKAIFHSFLYELDVNNVPGVPYAYLLSFLLTQPESYECWIWIVNLKNSSTPAEATSSSNNTYKLPMSDRLKPMLINEENFLNHLQDKQAGRNYFDTVLNQHVSRGRPTITMSDFIRMVALNAYGGVWVDVDTILMRSFQPLLNLQFVYRAGAGQCANIAVISFKKGGRLLHQYLDTMYDRQKRVYDPLRVWNGTRGMWCVDFNCTITSETSAADAQDQCIILPSVYFDAIWRRLDNKNTLPHFEPPLTTSLDIMSSKYPCDFSNDDIFAHFFKGAFAFHCHCYKHLVEEKGSCMYNMIQALQNKLRIN